MTAQQLDGRRVADEIREEIAADVTSLQKQTGRVPGLTVVLVGNNPASEAYVRSKGRAAEKAGIRSETIRLPESIQMAELLGLIDTLNHRDDVDGILVQLPLPEHIDKDQILLAISPAKDVDGFHPVSVGNMVAGRPAFIACTPAGVMELLRRSHVEIAGREAVVLGRSDIVGKPMALLLLHANATVTVCHSKTRNLCEVTRRGEILIAAIGKPGFVTEEHIQPGAVVVDVGINRIVDRSLAADLFSDDPARLAEFDRTGSALVGDCHPARARQAAGWLTPVPGGVGPLTIAMLLRNATQAFRRLHA